MALFCRQRPLNAQKADLLAGFFAAHFGEVTRNASGRTQSLPYFLASRSGGEGSYRREGANCPILPGSAR